MRLAESENIAWQGKTHFFRVATRQMRHILVDRGRRRRARKRVPELLPGTPTTELGEIDKLALMQALQELARLSPRQAQVFKLHCLGGFTFLEAAKVMSVSERTAKSEWAEAKSWLARYLTQSATD